MQNYGIKARKAIVKSIRFYVLKDIARYEGVLTLPSCNYCKGNIQSKNYTLSGVISNKLYIFAPERV